MKNKLIRHRFQKIKNKIGNIKYLISLEIKVKNNKIACKSRKKV